MPHRTITVLYIDDDPAICRLVQRFLTRRGYVTEVTHDAAGGLARVEAGGIDVVILDHELGQDSGLEVLAAIAGREQPPPVVYVTASTELSVAVQALKAGAVDYVVKTIGEDFEVLLVSALEQSVQKAQLTRAKEAAEREVREARDRAMVLLAEVNHRVANSLALVGSLVRMQATAVQDPGAKAALAETQARITAIGNLHRSLYNSDDVRAVDLAAYLGTLVSELRHSMSAAGHTPAVLIDAEPVQVATDRAISIGLIATELVTNAIKYAYPDGTGEVRVTLTDRVATYVLAVEDDGVGWTGVGTAQGSGLGSRIISAMAKGLATEIAYEARSRGTRAVLAVPRAPAA